MQNVSLSETPDMKTGSRSPIAIIDRPVHRSDQNVAARRDCSTPAKVSFSGTSSGNTRVAALWRPFSPSRSPAA
jgi:hypothetical protein